MFYDYHIKCLCSIIQDKTVKQCVIYMIDMDSECGEKAQITVFEAAEGESEEWCARRINCNFPKIIIYILYI